MLKRRSVVCSVTVNNFRYFRVNFVFDRFCSRTEEVRRFGRDEVHIIAAFRVLFITNSCLQQICGVIIYTALRAKLSFYNDGTIIKLVLIMIYDFLVLILN